MAGFIIRINDDHLLRFHFLPEAPHTTKAFLAALPFAEKFYHARISGQEIWMDKAPKLDVIQENVSIFANPGEIVIGPSKPIRNKIIGCMGIFYGEGKLLDGGNIFGKIWEEDMDALVQLGNSIWKKGEQILSFEADD
ncbi:MAG: hypothetical protein C5B52_06435 [Bacteroidetes bacterium]|nr:MAG: hypothetical protein C5B52_06435 [Bacteroidota bacterium]